MRATWPLSLSRFLLRSAAPWTPQLRSGAHAEKAQQVPPLGFAFLPRTQQQQQHLKAEALRLLRQHLQGRLLPHPPSALQAFFSRTAEREDGLRFAIATAAELAPVAASPVSSVEAVSPFAGVGAAAATAEAIRLAYRKSDWCALTAVTEKLLREAQQQQHEGQPHLVEDKARLLTPALLLLSLLQPPQRDGRVQRLLAAVKEIVQQQPHTRHPLPLSPGEAATLLAALGNLRIPAVSAGLFPFLADSPFDGEASAALACILVATAREQRLLQDGGKAPAETSQTWVDAAFPLLRRLLKGRGLSPEQACSVLQAAAYHAFFPQRLALLLPHTFPAAPWSLASKATTIPPGIAAGASRGPCSPAPLYIEALSACAEASDTPEALGLAATVTEAINRITVALQSSRNGEEVLSVEAILRLTEALVLRDFSFTSQLTTLAAHPQSAHEEQVQQTQQLWQAYKKDLDELLELLLDSFLRQRQQWGPYTVQELLLFLLGILRELWLNLAKASSINSATDAALLLRALSLLCSSGTTLNLASCDVTPCGALAAAAAAAAPPTSFGEDLERWGQQLLLQWQLVEAADFVPRPAAALQQQQLAEVDVHLKQQKQRAAQLQAKTAAQILQPSTGSTNLVPGTDAAPAVPNPSAVKSTSRTATPLVQPAAEAGPSVPLLLKAATESIFHSSATVSPPAALLLLRSFVALNSCGDFLAPSEAGAAGLAAMAFRSAALLQLYRSLQRQYLALMQHRQKQLSREQPRQLERDQQPERDSQQHGSQRQHEETQSRLRQLRQSLRFVQQQQLRLLDMLCRHDRQHTHARETAAGLIPLAAAFVLYAESGMSDAPLRLRLLLQLLVCVDLLPLRPLCGLAKALAANPDICLGAPLALPPDGEVAGEQELADRGGKAAASSLKASEDTAAAPHEAAENCDWLLQKQWAERLVASLFARSVNLLTVSDGSLMPVPFLTPTGKDLLELVAALHKAQLIQRLQKQIHTQPVFLEDWESFEEGYRVLQYSNACVGSACPCPRRSSAICFQLHVLPMGHYLGVWSRLSSKAQAAILGRLEEHDRMRLPLPSATERKVLLREPLKQRLVCLVAELLQLAAETHLELCNYICGRVSLAAL
ncbi:hypothetical protein cyc_04693 [Cyclospora cayetanensis]|uniref:RAP domain-containing protein n=1 Tax=Cyclospora cayetanensis TaxID=88456 RepID=A0A1D3CYG1_9EIME|nr:hypothetical protein cyc_04693 [Cyclospora cayetanensis]